MFHKSNRQEQWNWRTEGVDIWRDRGTSSSEGIWLWSEEERCFVNSELTRLKKTAKISLQLFLVNSLADAIRTGKLILFFCF